LASSEDLFCPNDGTRLVDGAELPSPACREAATVPDTPASKPKLVVASPFADTLDDVSTDPLIGKLVAGRYRIVRLLGEGGMGTVYRAMQETIEKRVALKVLKAEYSSSPEMVVRFRREAVSACRIKHPNVVDVFDFGELEDGRFYLAMELLEGRDLGQVLGKAGPLPAARAVHIALQICRALNAVHQSGIVHRDLKPENVFLHRTSDGDEIVKLVDFGIAHLLAHEPDAVSESPDAAASVPGERKLTRVGSVFGTPEYMAPEQATASRIDHRADVYATGIILYKMLTGQTPFSGESLLEIVAKQVGEAPPRMATMHRGLSVPRELEQVVMRALEKRPEDRFETMARFARAIAHASRDIRRSRGRWTGRASMLAVAAAALFVALLVGGYWLRRRAAMQASLLEPVRAEPRLPAEWAAVVDEKPRGLSSITPTASGSAIPRTEVEPAAAPAHTTKPPRGAGASLTSTKDRVPLAGQPRAQSADPSAEPSLPQLERCFETVEGVRREVPCN